MSLRAIAKELGISHTLLVLWRQGKRSLAPEIEARYHSLVTSGYNNGYKQSSSPEGGASHFEPALEDYVGAGRGTRTHTPFKVADFKLYAWCSNRFFRSTPPADSYLKHLVRFVWFSPIQCTSWTFRGHNTIANSCPAAFVGLD